MVDQHTSHGSAQNAILRTLREREVSFLDLHEDRDWLEQITPDPVSVIYRMRKKGLLHDVQRGRYTVNTGGHPTRRPVVDSLSDLAPAALDRLGHDYFLSWNSALWHHGLIDQQAQVLFVADPTHKRPVNVGRLKVRFVRIAQRKSFGWETAATSSGREIRIASIEKALVDSLDLPQYAAPMPIIAEALRTAYREHRLNVPRLVEFALRMGSSSLNRRLGFFMELFGISGAEPLLAHLGRGWAVPLAPGGPVDNDRTPVDSRWRVAQDPDVLVAAQRRR
jgi:predicted transcriptional regulator of viral defense system